MIGFKSLLLDQKEEHGPRVNFDNNSNGETLGYGVIKAGSVKFKKVTYLKGLKHILISISQVCDEENEVTFRKKAGII